MATQKIFFGPLKNEKNKHLKDLSLREGALLIPFVLVALGMGVFPQPFVDMLTPTLTRYVEHYQEAKKQVPLKSLGGMTLEQFLRAFPARSRPIPLKQPSEQPQEQP